MLSITNVEVDCGGAENVPSVGEGQLDIRRNVSGFAPVHVDDVLHASADVFHVVGCSLTFRATNFQIVSLQQKHQVTGWRGAVDWPTVTVLEQNREHSCVVEVGVGEHNSIQLFEGQRFRCGEVRHWIGV